MTPSWTKTHRRGAPNDPIAELSDFERIDFAGPNTMDAAVARVLDRDDVEPEILGVGRVQQPIMPVALYQSVRKHGRSWTRRRSPGREYRGLPNEASAST